MIDSTIQLLRLEDARCNPSGRITTALSRVPQNSHNESPARLSLEGKEEGRPGQSASDQPLIERRPRGATTSARCGRTLHYFHLWRIDAVRKTGAPIPSHTTQIRLQRFSRSRSPCFSDRQRSVTAGFPIRIIRSFLALHRHGLSPRGRFPQL